MTLRENKQIHHVLENVGDLIKWIGYNEAILVYVLILFQVDDELEIKAYYAGHVLGAAMFQMRVGNQSVVYTVSYKYLLWTASHISYLFPIQFVQTLTLTQVLVSAQFKWGISLSILEFLFAIGWLQYDAGQTLGRSVDRQVSPGCADHWDDVRHNDPRLETLQRKGLSQESARLCRQRRKGKKRRLQSWN